MLEDLRKSVTEMTDEELRNALKDIRSSRRTPKASTHKAREKAVTNNEPTKAAVGSLLQTLSPEEKAALLKSLMGD